MAAVTAPLNCTDVSRLWHLKACPLFAAFTDEELGALFHASRVLTYEAGTVIPSASDAEPALWVVKRGYVGMKLCDEDGHQITVTVLQPGDMFGALSPGADERYGEAYRSLSSVCLCRTPMREFNLLLARYPNIAFRLAKKGLDRMHRLQVRLADLMMRPVESRLAFVLLELDAMIGREHKPEGRALAAELSHVELAQLVGASREMISHVMRRFRQQGMVETQRKHIVLLDLEALELTRDGKYEWTAN